MLPLAWQGSHGAADYLEAGWKLIGWAGEQGADGEMGRETNRDYILPRRAITSPQTACVDISVYRTPCDSVIY